MKASFAIVFLSQVTGGCAIGTACDVDIETKVGGVGAWGVASAKMCFATVDGVVALLLEKAGQGGDGGGERRVETIGGGLYAVDVPSGGRDERGGFVGGGVALECPVGHAMAGGIHARKERTTRGRTHGTGVSVGEFDATGCQALHVGGAIAVVEGGGRLIEWHGGLLPPHVVDEKKDDVGTRCGGSVKADKR